MNNFQETIKKYNLIQKNDKLLVGVSGGPDSLALLFQLNNLKNKLNLTLHIAHLDHGLRKDSHRDLQFVQKLADQLDIPITIKKINPKLLKNKGSLEEVCREVRQDFFIQTAKKIKANKIALGHNLNDQAETVLMRILRGTGLSGLSGIWPKREIRNIIFIRPLIETSRSEIERYLKRKKINPCLDPTNHEELFFRNKIRYHLIPILKEKYNQNIVEVLASLADNTAYDYEYLDQVTKNNLKGNLKHLNIKKLLKLHPAILRLKIRQGISNLQGDTRRIGFVHIKEVEDLLKNRPCGAIVDLPKGISVQKTHSALHFYKL
ncbi:MAG: tRNA lysidine(34) synthetase TilS [Candidatus Omnitrophota bacterium]